MFKKKVLKILLCMVCIAALILPHSSVVLAEALTNKTPNDINKVNLISSKYHEGQEESTESLSDEGRGKYDETPYIYTFGGSGGTPILKVVRQDDKDTSGAMLFSDAFYCLNGEKSFPDFDGAIEYSRTIDDFFRENPTTLGISQQNYNSLCWLLDNMYLRKQMTTKQREEQKNSLINKAFDSVINNNTYQDTTTVDDIKAKVTDDDIEVVQQWAIWYFTNNGRETLQHIPYTNDQNTLPSIDLTSLDISTLSEETDSMDTKDSTRKEWLEKLYQYFVVEAKSKANEEYQPSSTNDSKYPKIVNRNISCEIEGENYKIGPYKISAPDSSIKSSDYQIKLTDGQNEIGSSSYTVKDISGNVISKKVNEIFDTEYYIYLPINKNVKTVKLELSYTKYQTKASVWQASNATFQPLVLLTKEGEKEEDSVSVQINPEYDMALRKYIIAVNNTEIKDRKPDVDATELADGSSQTAKYKHKKQPVEVKKGDTVTYRISIYNEGNMPGKVTKIVDYLPDGLEFISENNINKQYGWKSEDGKTVVTEISKDTELPAFDKKNIDLTNTYLDIVCKVSDKAVFGSVLTNIAEIADDNVDDRDSTPESMKTTIDTIDRSTYVGNKNNDKDLTKSDYFYKGNEDDDDFEKVVVAGKSFDLSLQKFITEVNGKTLNISREPVVNTEPLKKGSTNVEFKQVKTPVLVQPGDIVKYKIRIYNEGETDGYAESIADYIPDGLGYLVNHKTNVDNYWSLPTSSNFETVKLNTLQSGTKNLKVEDFTGVTDINNVDVVKGDVKITSTALSSKVSDKNLINAFDGKSDKLNYKDVEVVCIVLANANLKNIAEITDDSDSNKKDVEDRDSVPDTVDSKNYPGNEKIQDDHDYEILTMRNFDLSLQKFITGVNDKSITNREPKVEFKEDKIAYQHPQDVVDVNNGDLVTYTIRVYNEGDTDGYAAEIGDDIPEGIEFVPSNETNTKYGWKMYDANKAETNDASKAVEIRTDYLSKTKSEARKENCLLTAFDKTSGKLSYFDVKAVFKVNTKKTNEVIINTAEITKDTDKDDNEIDDIDSIPDNKKEDEDDIDKERIKVGYFDLALKKDVIKAIVTENGSTREVPASGGIVKVEVNRKKINSTIVKFVYNITITNEGTIPGYAKEITDYIPDGLQFVAEDNQNWTGKPEGVIKTNALENTLLQPGQSANVQVVLRWINGENNLGQKINVAEISKDYNEANDTDDIDSTPDNKKDGEDDIDNAPVVLSISTGTAPAYVILSTTVLAILSTGIIMIKRYVL